MSESLTYCTVPNITPPAPTRWYDIPSAYFFAAAFVLGLLWLSNKVGPATTTDGEKSDSLAKRPEKSDVFVDL